MYQELARRHLGVRLPTELLSGVFLYIVESGLQDDDALATRTSTFNLLQACRCRDEVAVRSPQLWAQWAAGVVKVWPLFKSRLKDASLSLTPWEIS